ncbi:MAG: glycosyltransferase [Lachnospiraceae bacterium]|nr:glycosyltransferase [Lachnospiraceae bacterium]
MKKVILITSTYNGAVYLPAMLDSIAAQTYTDIDLYVRDDGSKDNSVKILKQYQKSFPEGKRIILINEKDNDWGNKGSHQSYRYLIRSLGNADYYLFCDQDDVWAPDKVERAVSHMEQYAPEIPVLYVHNYYVCDGSLNIKHTLPDRPSVTPKEMQEVSLSKVIMTGTWGGVGMAQGFNRTLKELTFDCGEITPSVAVDCWISWVVAGMNGALIYDNKPLAYYRRHTGTYSSGGAGGLLRYKDWRRHMNRHCSNITNGIRDYNRLYGERVSKERAAFLVLFDSHNRLGKFCYPHRLRTSLLDEIAFRLLILLGKI